jgi:hypothetical protein
MSVQVRYPGSYGLEAAKNLSAFRGRLLSDLVSLDFRNTFNGSAPWCTRD